MEAYDCAWNIRTAYVHKYSTVMLSSLCVFIGDIRSQPHTYTQHTHTLAHRRVRLVCVCMYVCAVNFYFSPKRWLVKISRACCCGDLCACTTILWTHEWFQRILWRVLTHTTAIIQWRTPWGRPRRLRLTATTTTTKTSAETSARWQSTMLPESIQFWSTQLAIWSPSARLW